MRNGAETDPHLPCRLLATPVDLLLRLERARIIACAERRGASNVRIFGRVARADHAPESDVDILEPRVDVVPARCLKPAIAIDALNEAIPL